MCTLLGIPIAEEKTVLPCTCLIFLGLKIYTVSQQVIIPADKLVACRERLVSVQNKDELLLLEIQSFLGQGGRAFLQRLVNLTRGIVNKSKPIALGPEAQADITICGFNF